MEFGTGACINYYKGNKSKCFLIYFFLLIGIILPSFISIRNEYRKTVETKVYNLNSVGEIVKDVRIEEKIYLPSHIKEYGVMFSTYDRKNRGKIKIEVIQGDKKTEEIVDVSKIKYNEYYKLNIKGLRNGEALLVIEGIDGQEGSSVTLYKTSDILYGNVVQNGQSTEEGLLHRIFFNEYNDIVKGQIIFMLLSVLCYFYFLRLIREEEKNNKKIYLTTALLIYLIVASRAPVLTFKVEPYAEQVFNFLYNARTYGVLKNLTLMEGGYLPLFHRIIAVAIVKLGFNGKITLYLMSNVALIILSLMVSCFMLKEYRKYGDIFYRFVVCMVFGAFSISTYIETHTFITFAYLNILLLFYISLLDLNSIGRKNYIALMVLVFVSSLSKFLFVVLLPISVVVLIVLWKKLSIREKIFLGLISVAETIQIFYTYFNANNWKMTENSLEKIKVVGRGTIVHLRPLEKLKITEMFNMVLHQTLQQFIYVFNLGVDRLQNVLNLNIQYLILFILLIIFFLYIILKNRDKESLVMISLLAIVFGVCCINVIARIWDGTNLWETTIMSINAWQSILIKASFILILVLLPSKIKNSNMKGHVYFLIILFLIVRFSPFKDWTIFRNDTIASDWSIYSKFFDSGRYLIPVEPFYTSDNEKFSYVGRRIEKPELSNFQGERYYLEGLDDIEALTEMNLPRPMKIEYLYLKRGRDYHFTGLKLIGYDKNGNRVLELRQLNKIKRGYVGFNNTGEKVEVSKLEFQTENGNKSYVIPEVFIGESLE